MATQHSTQGDYLDGELLIAVPSMLDPNFQRTVTLLCQHDENGALGIGINRESGILVGEILDQLGIPNGNASWAAQPVLIGGPVHNERGFVLHERGGRWDSSIDFGENLSLTTSRDILVALAAGDGPENAVMTLGYAGWEAGQLEAEFRENTWLSSPADHDLLFAMPHHARWQAAANKLGIDLLQLSSLSGNA